MNDSNEAYIQQNDRLIKGEQSALQEKHEAAKPDWNPSNPKADSPLGQTRLDSRIPRPF